MNPMHKIGILACLGFTAFAAQRCLASAVIADSVDLAFVGDIMLAETPGELIAKGIDPFEPFAAILDRHDVRIGNLECVIARSGNAEIKPFTFRADPQTIPILARHFDGVSLANNHSGDFGKAAFSEQLGLLQAAKLPYFGGGENAGAAHTPWIVERNGLRIALLGYDEFKPRSFEANATRPGVAWSGEDDHVLRDIAVARDRYRADIIIPFMHWGWEDERTPSPRQREFARRMIDAGAAMVVGSHPHVTQGYELYRGKLIMYSLGNFLFNGFDTEATLTGWVLSVRMGKNRIHDWQVHIAKLDANGVPHPEAESLPCLAGSTPMESGRCQPEKLATALLALGIASSAFADADADTKAKAKTREVHCQVIYGGEMFPVVGKPAADPYQVEGQKIGRYFEFKIVYITEPAAFAGVNLYTYSMFSGEPVLVHQGKYAPPYRNDRGRYGFTGLNSVYEPSKSSEMQYWCGMR